MSTQKNGEEDLNLRFMRRNSQPIKLPLKDDLHSNYENNYWRLNHPHLLHWMLPPKFAQVFPNLFGLTKASRNGQTALATEPKPAKAI
jgi:hypothetical protein